MLCSVRRVAPVVLVACLGLVAGCGASANKGKIEGKWKVNSAPGLGAAEMKALQDVKATPYMEFKPDGTVVFSVDATPEIIKLMETSGEKMTQTGTYKLLSGNNVELTGIGEAKGGLFGGGKGKAGRVEITINGDNMTIKAADGTLQLTRWK